MNLVSQQLILLENWSREPIKKEENIENYNCLKKNVRRDKIIKEQTLGKKGYIARERGRSWKKILGWHVNAW